MQMSRPNIDDPYCISRIWYQKFKPQVFDGNAEILIVDPYPRIYENHRIYKLILFFSSSHR